jgi:hypothetical protein
MKVRALFQYHEWGVPPTGVLARVSFDLPLEIQC